ncbi:MULTISPECIES: RNA polymerase sigma factor [Bacillaceae]|uniref:RNA polymerase sigma factor n=1 Tax=Evansella alkalicola TaxID=745819 RepID=A0ABS6JN86_9BACI|nr:MULTISPECIES: RNA polymerase sigma factor [Bacillaceae]MBU9720020.1 RNA polymerase sigma factor [Bacillus alkalicola]
MNDYELIRDSLDGDQVALERLHERYVDRIFHYIYIQTNSYHDTEELLQDVFFKVSKELHRFEGKSTFKTWLFKIARNTVIDYYRTKKKAQLSVPLELENLEEIVGHSEAAEDTVLRKVEVDKVIQMIDQLPSHYKSILHLRFFEGFSIKETAQVMGKSVLSVKAMQRRAKQTLIEKVKLEVQGVE